MKELPEINDVEKETLLTELRDGKFYANVNFAMHVKDASQIGTHCIPYALSDDRSGVEFNKNCDHVHTTICASCQQIETLFHSIKTHISSSTYSTPKAKLLAQHDAELSTKAIRAWLGHQVSTLQQDKSRQDVLDSLTHEDVLITMDFAMKWLPAKHRDTTKNWFGLRGLSWHISCAITKSVDGTQFRLRYYIHVSKEAKQDSQHVTAIIRDTIQRIQSEISTIKNVYLRSDNAMCYKAANTITTLFAIARDLNVKIKRYDFSDSQSGKGPADRMAAVAKRNVKQQLNSGENCATPSEFARCLAGGRGIASTTIIHIDLIGGDNFRKATIPDISYMHSFKYEDQHLRMWKYYKIGDGKTIPKRRFDGKDNKMEIKVLSVFNRNEQAADNTNLQDDQLWKSVDAGHESTAPEVVVDDGADDSEDINLHDSRGDFEGPFNCPEPNCLKSYLYMSGLENHMLVGKHKLAVSRMTIQDYSLNSYARKLENSYLNAYITGTEVEEIINENTRNENNYPIVLKGWACKTRESGRHSAAQKAFMIQLFEEGKRRGRKLSPREAVTIMRNDDRFTPEQILKESQILSFWSKRAREQRGIDQEDEGKISKIFLTATVTEQCT